MKGRFSSILQGTYIIARHSTIDPRVREYASGRVTIRGRVRSANKRAHARTGKYGIYNNRVALVSDTVPRQNPRAR